MGGRHDGACLLLSKIKDKSFRRHFPEGEPADYETDMTERIHEMVANTPGDFQKVITQEREKND